MIGDHDGFGLGYTLGQTLTSAQFSAISTGDGDGTDEAFTGWRGIRQWQERDSGLHWVERMMRRVAALVPDT